MGKKSSSPPDTKGAATIQGEFSRETARDVTYADRPDQNNPFGNTTWTTRREIDPATGAPVTKFSQNQTLNSQNQKLLDSQIANNNSYSSMAGGKMNAIQNELGEAANFDQFGDVNASGIEATTGGGRFSYDGTENRQNAEDASYARATSRLDPRFAEEQQRFDVQMANRGLRQGDSAYDTAFDNFSRGKNDAYEQARLGSVAEGRTEDQQAFSQQANVFGTNQQTEQQQFSQNMSSNERANALRSQQIEEFLGKRGQSLSEAQALQDSMNIDELTETFAGGS